MPDAWIRQWGDPQLHERARIVEVFDDLLREQARRMRERLTEADGAGLAATQVGLLRRLFVFRLTPEHDIDVLVNPRIVSASVERTTFVEGCLSFNTVAVAVERPAAVRIAAQDLDGRPRELEGDGFAASLLQHEIDHLDGILTLDRAGRAERHRAITDLLARGDAHAKLAA
jgi:peptide deformylase